MSPFSFVSLLVLPLVLLVLLLLVFASAVDVADAAYNPQLGKEALLYSKAVASDLHEVKSWSCEACKKLHNLTDVKVVHPGNQDQFLAVLSYNTKRQMIFVAFKPIFNWISWLIETLAIKTEYPFCKMCRVQLVFWDTYVAGRAELIHKVRGMRVRWPGVPVLVTGWSSGGSLALMAGVHLTQQEGLTDVWVYTFGEPRAGNGHFAHYAITSLDQDKRARVTHHDDPVVHVPWKWLGFMHAGHEIYYPNSHRWMECPDLETPEAWKCSRHAIPWNFLDHLVYLGTTIGVSANLPSFL